MQGVINNMKNMINDKIIKKVTVEYSDGSEFVCDDRQLFVAIVDENQEVFNIEHTDKIFEYDIIRFSENALIEASNRKFVEQVKRPSKTIIGNGIANRGHLTLIK